MFSLGGSKSKTTTNQRAESNEYGYSVTGSGSSAISGGSSFGRTSQDVFAGGLLESIYGRAAGAASTVDPSTMQAQIGQLFTGGLSILDRLSGGAGEDYLTERLSGPGAADAQIEALSSDLGRFFNEQIMPGIRGSAVAAGALGGGREGVASGLAGREVMTALAREAANLRARDQQQRDQAAVELMGGRTAREATAAGFLPQLGGVSQMGFGAELSPWTQLLSAMGGPTTLTTGEQGSQDFARQLSESFGISEDVANSLMTMTSTSKSKGFKLGIGGSGDGLFGFGG